MQIVTILGSNAGDKRRLLAEAVRLMGAWGKVVRQSSLYETEPWGFECKERFLNQVVVFDTTLSPLEFLHRCQETEKQLGRVRPKDGPRYASRPIDIDLLFCDALVIENPELTVPHPRISERRFVLVPLAEIMPEFVHPVHRKTIAALEKACPDRLEVREVE